MLLKCGNATIKCLCTGDGRASDDLTSPLLDSCKIAFHKFYKKLLLLKVVIEDRPQVLAVLLPRRCVQHLTTNLRKVCTFVQFWHRYRKLSKANDSIMLYRIWFTYLLQQRHSWLVCIALRIFPIASGTSFLLQLPSVGMVFGPTRFPDSWGLSFSFM